jgi:hypothetical protein
VYLDIQLCNECHCTVYALTAVIEGYGQQRTSRLTAKQLAITVKSPSTDHFCSVPGNSNSRAASHSYTQGMLKEWSQGLTRSSSKQASMGMSEVTSKVAVDQVKSSHPRITNKDYRGEERDCEEVGIRYLYCWGFVWAYCVC